MLYEQLFIQIPKHIKKGKEIKVNLTKQHIKIDIIESNEVKNIINSDLPWPIRAEESTWSLVPGEYIHVINRIQYHNIFIQIYSYRFPWKKQWKDGGKISQQMKKRSI